jgi:hypothetical protein
MTERYYGNTPPAALTDIRGERRTSSNPWFSDRDFDGTLPELVSYGWAAMMEPYTYHTVSEADGHLWAITNYQIQFIFRQTTRKTCADTDTNIRLKTLFRQAGDMVVFDLPTLFGDKHWEGGKGWRMLASRTRRDPQTGIWTHECDFVASTYFLPVKDPSGRSWVTKVDLGTVDVIQTATEREGA